MLLFFTSINNDNTPHKIKIPANPDNNAKPIFCLISNATKKAMRAMLHQGEYKPAIKLSVAVNKVAKMKRMNTDYAFVKLSLPMIRLLFVSDSFIIQSL